jgi:cytochrome c-type biogenesis protein CcmF
VWRLPDLADRRSPGAPISRESAFLFNNVLFLGITFAVVFGTLYPLGAQLVSGATVSVGTPYFNTVNAPLFLLLLFLMGVGPALPWGIARWSTVRNRFAVPVLAGAASVLLAWALGMRAVAPLATLGLALFVLTVLGDELLRGTRARSASRGEQAYVAAWRLASRNRRRYGGYLVHAGICVMAVAIAVSASLGQDALQTLKPGESMSIRGYTLTYHGLVREPLRDDSRVLETRAEVGYTGPQNGTLATALRDYPSSNQPIATPAVRSNFGEDLYVTLNSYDPQTSTVTLHVLINPLVSWIWIGGAVVGVGAIFAIWPDRRRLPVDLSVARTPSVKVPAARVPVPEAAAPSIQAEEA